MNKALTKTETVQQMSVWKSNWKEALRNISVTKEMTFADLRKLETPSVSMLNIGEKSTENGVMVFQALVNNIVKFLGAEWTTEQVLECGKICFDEAHYLTFAELAQFAQKAKSGGFEKVYGKFTPATFMEWFVVYCSDNLEQRQNYFMNQKPIFLPPENPVSEELVLSTFKDIADTLTSELEAEKREDIEEKDKRLRAYNEMLLNQARISGKIDTTQQIPDTCENDIPNE